MIQKIFIIIIGIIIAIPVLLWFAIRGIFTGSWKLLGFICQRQYRELKRLCECGTSAELEAFLAAHPGAREYIVYTRQGATTTVITTLFRLPAPLAVAGQANNLAVIPILLANGASPEVRSVSAKHSPAEEAIGNPEKMRVLCNGKTWWLEQSAKNSALEKAVNYRNFRSIIWNVMRGARLTNPKLLYSLGFMKLPMAIKEFVCRFGIDNGMRADFHNWVKDNPVTRKHVEMTFQKLIAGVGNEFDRRMKLLAEVPVAMNMSCQPLPSVDDNTMERLMFTAGLLDRTRMLELLDNLFSQEQQFAILEKFTTQPVSTDNREMAEDTVDLLLCSILKKAEAKG